LVRHLRGLLMAISSLGGDCREVLKDAGMFANVIGAVG
jgi:hypothetical protein